MTTPRLEIPNVSGKTVESIVLYNDPSSGRELTIRFSDGTEVSIMIECKQIAEVRHFVVKSDQMLFEVDEANL